LVKGLIVEKLNDWMTLIANIGVVAGIVFLAYEIRVNTNAVSTASATSYIGNWIQETGAIGRDPEITTITQKINTEGWTNVSPVQAQRVAYVATAQYKAAELAYFQWQQGNLDAGLWRGNDLGTYRYLWIENYMREFWLFGGRDNFAPAFREYVDQMISDICSRRECRPVPSNYDTPSELASAVSAWGKVSR
jgi:hypothetical protein